jgi:nucleoside-diphosphate-sugar epimerase
MQINNILIMGGSGPIGKALSINLSKNNNIYLFDKKVKKNLNKNINFILGDCLKFNDLKKLPNKIDIVFFFIGMKGGPKSNNIKNLDKYIEYNFETLFLFLDFFKKKKIKKIIFSSTEHVYGDNDISNKKCLNLEPFPKNYYGFSKLLAEKYLYNFYKKTTISVDILRMPRVVYFDDNGIISKIIMDFFTNKIFIKKFNTRFNFIFIDDLISAMNICVAQQNTKFRILNIFNDCRPASLLTIVRKITNIIGKKCKIYLVNHKVNNHNPTGLNVSNKFTKSSLNWKPLFSLERIIIALVNYYQLKKKIQKY